MTSGSAGAAATGGNAAVMAGAGSTDAGTAAINPSGGNAGGAGVTANAGVTSGGAMSSAGGVGGATGGGTVADGGAAGGGAGGAAGDAAMLVTCEGAPVPLKSTWKASASHSSLGVGVEFYNPPEYVMDSSAKRWSTGKPQAGDEWLQVDFGADAAIRELSFTLNPDDADDYPRSYQIQISDTPLDFSGAIRASGAGAQGQTLVVTLAEPVVGRYLLVQQKGKDAANWWSVSELTVACF